MILAIALLGLSINLIKSACFELLVCVWPLVWAFGKQAHGPRTVGYSIFLGLFGIMISTIGTVALFIDGIPTIVPLVGDSFGALCFLAGGIAWIVNTGGRIHTCGEWNDVPDNEWARTLNDSVRNSDRLSDAIAWVKDVTISACKQGNAEHGLAWALFTITTCLVICNYLRRRDLAKSSK